jgi:hypothetical protein
MIRKKTKKTTSTKIVIDLTGPDGNAFALLAYAGHLGQQLGMAPGEIESMREEMISSDYENLIETFDRRFGDFVILER